MYFKQFLHDDLGCSSYFVASRQSREAAVIDPQSHIEQYTHLAHERGYTITAVIDTHLHADHVSGNRALAAATGAKLYLHESADVLFPFEGLRDGDDVSLGQVILRIEHTPGHRPEAISILVLNPIRSPEPSMLLSGDTLFVGDVGRPDFGGEEGARQQYDSIQRLLGLEDWVEVFPAHFEGSCGKGMCGRPSSTIGFERRFNPVLQLNPREFIEYIGDTPARPLNMTAIIDANRGASDFSWNMALDLEAVPTVPLHDAESWMEEHGPIVVDVREPEEYALGHIPQAVSIPQADLASRLSELPGDRDVLVVCAGGVRSQKAAAFLRANHFGRAASLSEGTDGWREAGHAVAIGA